MLFVLNPILLLLGGIISEGWAFNPKNPIDLNIDSSSKYIDLLGFKRFGSLERKWFEWIWFILEIWFLLKNADLFRFYGLIYMPNLLGFNFYFSIPEIF